MNKIFQILQVVYVLLISSLSNHAYGQEKQLSLPLSNSPNSLDPAQVNSSSDIVIRNIFSTLTRFKDGQTVGDLAELSSVSQDGLTYTFRLHPNLKWSDGSPLTTEDVIYAWQRLVNPRNGFLNASYLLRLDIQNVDDIIEGKAPVSSLGITALDSTQFKVIVKKPTPWLVDAMANIALAPVPSQLIKKLDDEWSRSQNIISSGAYRVENFIINNKIDLVLNDYYGGNKAFYKTVYLPTATNHLKNFSDFLLGRYTMVQEPFGAAKRFSGEKSSVKSIKFYRHGITFIVFNQRLKEFADIRVRKAITLAFNPKFVINKIMRGTVLAADSFIPPLVTPQDIANNKLKQNQAEIKLAQDLIAQAGYSSSNPLNLNLAVPNTDDTRIYLAFQSMIKQNLKESVQINLNFMEASQFKDIVLLKHDFQIARQIWEPTFFTPASYLAIMRSDDANNLAAFSNKEFDSLFEKARTSNLEESNIIYQQMNKILNDSYSVIPLFYGLDSYASWNYLGGFDTTTPNWRFADIH